jgi:hypothetical protein
MTLLLADGFDTYTTNADMKSTWQVSNGGVTVAQTGRFSVGSSIRIPFGRYIAYPLDNTPTTLIVGFAMYPTIIQRDNRTFLRLLSQTAGVLFQFQWFDTSPRFTVGSTTYSPAPTLINEGWHYFEVKFIVSATVGRVVVRIDGSQVIDTGNVNTGTTGVGSVRFLGYDDVRFSGNLFDDIYICDGNGSTNNDFLGPCKVRYFLPTANGDTNNWTASTGSNYQCVDDTPPYNTTDYVSTTGVGNKDNYTFQTVSNFADIKGVAVYLVAIQTDVELKSIRAIAKSGGVEATGSAQQTFNSYYPHLTVFETDPSTSVAWTQSGVNAAYFGIKLES